jgi:hypothetical protein
MPNTVWKSAERRVLALFDGTREGPTGETGYDGFSGARFKLRAFGKLGVEIKYRAQLPTWLREAVRQADDSQAKTLAEQGEMTTPCVVLVPKNTQAEDCLLVIRVGTFAAQRAAAVDNERKLFEMLDGVVRGAR